MDAVGVNIPDVEIPVSMPKQVEQPAAEQTNKSVEVPL